VPPVLNMVGLVLAGSAILRYGTPEQQARHLRQTLSAEQVWCQLFSEPGAGSDLGSLSTRAERDGDRFVVNGQKVWCSGGRISNWGILMARTDPDVPKHQGISFFLCPMDAPGVEARPLRQMTGGAEFDEVFLTDVVLSADHVLGPLHAGWGVGMDVLTNERGHIGTAVISLQRRLDQIASIGTERALGPAARDRLAGLMATGTAYRSLAARAGPQATTASSLLKLGITELMFDVATLRADTAGADALVAGPDAAGMLAAPGGRIAGGTSQVQRNIIGERLLGLPREPRP
jgi:alkylation response protein AidB-like acyl-CoA dehydrogenase